MKPSSVFNKPGIAFPWSSGSRDTGRPIAAWYPPGPDEAGDRGGGLADLLGTALAVLGNGLRHAVAEVVFQEPERDRLQCPGDRRDLRENVNAVLILVNHPLQAAHLPFDAAQSPEVPDLVTGVAVQLALRSSWPTPGDGRQHPRGEILVQDAAVGWDFLLGITMAFMLVIMI
jgi:hypothetical protein